MLPQRQHRHSVSSAQSTVPPCCRQPSQSMIAQPRHSESFQPIRHCLMPSGSQDDTCPLQAEIVRPRRRAKSCQTLENSTRLDVTLPAKDAIRLIHRQVDRTSRHLFEDSQGRLMSLIDGCFEGARVCGVGHRSARCFELWGNSLGGGKGLLVKRRRCSSCGGCGQSCRG
jgi:hypothetical protein